MKVWVVVADVMTDASGEIIDRGGVYGIYTTEQLAKFYARTFAAEDGFRTLMNYTLEIHEVES